MHKMEQKDVVKDLFGNGTESEYLKYFTAKFPKLLVHCYNAMNDATDLLTENYILYGMECLKLKGSQMTINCADDITFSEMKIELIDTLKIYNSSRLFIEENKSFSNFLQINGSNITQLKFSRGALTFESLDKILQELPNLKEVQFDGVEYEDSKAVLITKCHNLVQSEIWSAESSKLLQAFLECQTMQKLKIQFPKETLEEILQTYPSLEELEVIVEDNYPVSDENEANATTHQLKVLTVELWTNDEKIQEKLVSSILKQNNLQQFNFNSENIFIQKFPQSLCQQLAAHIWQLKRLTSLSISDEIFLQEVEVFVANGRVAWITNLEEFGSNLRYFMSLPSSFLGNFTNLRKLGIDCNEAEETQVEDLISFMNKSKLTSIRLELPPPCFQLLKQLQVGSLQVLDILIDSRYKKVPVFNILQEFLLRHQNITEFKISFCDDYDEPESLELIPRILATLKKLEILKVDKCPKITPGVIEQIAALKTLKFWKINYHSSKNFYKTQNWRS